MNLTIIEAAELLEDYSALIKAMLTCIESIEPKDDASGYPKKIDFPHIITTALKEVQQYRKIGTVDKCRDAVEKIPRLEKHEDVVKELDTLKIYARQLKWERDAAEQQLAEIGLTIGAKMDKVKEAMEKQKPMCPDIIEGVDEDIYTCPNCCEEIYPPDDCDDLPHHYCLYCGQTLEWEE